MTRPLVRTYDEAMLYLKLQPCACGGQTSEWQNAFTFDGTAPARIYYTGCPSCGVEREYVFRLPERPLLPAPDVPVLFGGSEPSELFDAGEWLRIADVCSRSAVPVGRDEHNRPKFDVEGEQALDVAIAAMDEVLKFLPEDADRAPDHAFWSDLGRQVHQKERGRFDRVRLDVIRKSYWNQRHAVH